MDGLAQGTRLVIVRHGEAVCNAEEFIGGHRSCRGLTELGIRQAEALAARLERTRELADATAFYTSVLPRAAETASLLSHALDAATFVETCSLCERHPGDADGLTWLEYSKRYERRSLPGDTPDQPLAPGGESWVDFLDRASQALVDVASAHPGELVVVVAHGGVVDSSVIRFLGLADHGAGVRLHPEHTSLTEWQHTGARWRLVRYNDAAHLLDSGGAHDQSGRRDALVAAPPAWVESEPASPSA